MKRSSKENQANLFAIAEGQGGFFTAKQAEEAGFVRKHHDYHVQVGNWYREHRGIYRLVRFPSPERSDLILWSLWSRNREDNVQGVYSHQTALSIYDLSDLMPSKLHMTVPRNFRRSATAPSILALHHADIERRIRNGAAHQHRTHDEGYRHFLARRCCGRIWNKNFRTTTRE